MKHVAFPTVSLLALLQCTLFALSVGLPSPEIRFPKNYDKERAERIMAVLRQPEFKYVDGLTSLWPPAWGTTLVYNGDAQSLRAFLAAIRKVEGVAVEVTLSPDLAKESGTGHSVGTWWVMYRHTKPDLLTVRVNLAAKNLKLEELSLPISETPIRTPLTPEAREGPEG